MKLVAPSRRTLTQTRRHQSRGQVLVIFAGAAIVLFAMMAVVIDVSWLWVNSLRIQRAADAAALAGVVMLPGKTDCTTGACSVARAEATKNGYANGTGGVSVIATQDATNPLRLNVAVSAPVGTFFMRVFGMTMFQATRTSKAEYALPVPMGSPLNVFGQPTAVDAQGNALNFWGAIMGPDTAKANGDPYATKVDNPGENMTNAEYVNPVTGAAGPYNYAIETTGATTNLTVSLYDPAYCKRASLGTETGDNDYGSNHTINTTYTLYAPSLTPYDYAHDTEVATRTFTSAADCGVGSKNAWVSFATIATPQVGTYRLNVSTTKASGGGNATNQFSIRATVASGAAPQVYGLGAMSIFANITTGVTNLYLAQIKAKDAGKTMEVRLFDPGDASGNASMQFMMPTSTGWQAQNFTYYDAGVDGTLTPAASASMNSLVTTSGGTVKFQGHWVVVSIPIPTGYTAPQGGWWKVAYTYSNAATDRTTWRVNIRGNPVHLIVP